MHNFRRRTDSCWVMHVCGISRRSPTTCASADTYQDCSVPAAEGPQRPRWMRGIWVESIHRDDKLRETPEADSRQLPGLQSGDRRLREAAGAGKVALGPTDAASAPLDHDADDLPPSLDVRVAVESTLWGPRHLLTLGSGAHPPVIGSAADDAAEVHRLGDVASGLENVHQPGPWAVARGSVARRGRAMARRGVARRGADGEAGSVQERIRS